MINKKFDFKKTELEEGIAELERDLEKSEGQDPIKTEYIRKLLGYMKKMSTLMVPEATQEQRAELEYLSECSACVSREMASVLTKIPVKEVMIKSAETMGITVEKKNGILVVNLPMILPTKLSLGRYQIECEETYNSYIKTYLDEIKYDKESNHA